MRAAIIIRDVTQGRVEVTTEMSEITALEEKSPPTPAAIIALGAHTLFDAGVLAQAGAIAVKELEEGRSPVEAIRNKYGNGDSD